MSVNSVQIIGHVAKPPLIRVTNALHRVLHLTVATNDKWTDTSGKERSTTEFHTIVVRKPEDSIAYLERHAVKGREIFVCGRLMTVRKPGEYGRVDYEKEIVVDEIFGDVKPLGRKDDAPAEPQEDAYDTV